MRALLFILPLFGVACTFSGDIDPEFECSQSCETDRADCETDCQTECANPEGDLDEACDEDCVRQCDEGHEECTLSCD